ncbi:MAG: hypothetical protein V2B13_11965 [Pseudomonadota bacterium]
MSILEELKDRFSKLVDEEKVAFMKSVMPSFCQIISPNAGKMMSLCRDMMGSCQMDMPGMMKMMAMMGGTMGASKG